MRSRWGHENDTEDIPTGQDPVGFVQLRKHKKKAHKHHKHHHHRGHHHPKRHSLLQLDGISHENDTDDVGYESKVSNAYESYDIHHTKEWNAKVNQKAAELENQMQEEDEQENNRKLAQKEKEDEEAENRRIQLQ